MNILNLSDINKSYYENSIFTRKKSKTVINNLNLSIKESEIYGLLGVNGAGKTTLIRMIMGILLPDSGTIEFCGHNALENSKIVKKKIGTVLGGERSLYWKLTGYENLEFFGNLYGLHGKELKRRISTVIELFGLDNFINNYVGTYSKGMKQKLIIAKALLHEPDLLLLDEPTVGLDIKSAYEFRKVIKELKKNLNISVLLTTHYLQEAEELSDRVGILNNGHIVKEDTVSNLKELYSKNISYIVKVKNPSNNFHKGLENIDGIVELSELEEGQDDTKVYKIILRKGQYDYFNNITTIMNKESLPISIEYGEVSLEDILLKYV